MGQVEDESSTARPDKSGLPAELFTPRGYRLIADLPAEHQPTARRAWGRWLLAQQPRYAGACELCGAFIPQGTATQGYCASACRKRADYWRHREARAAAERRRYHRRKRERTPGSPGPCPGSGHPRTRDGGRPARPDGDGHAEHRGPRPGPEAASLIEDGTRSSG